MPQYRKTIIVGHSPDDLFDLVSDIASYPSFIKWIKALRVRDLQAGETSTTCMADVAVGFRGLVERFTTKVVADRASMRVSAHLVRGPLRSLENTWLFEERTDGSASVEFYVDYEFSNPLLRALAATNQSLAVSKLINAFMDEANRRYGPPADVSASVQ